MYRTRSAKESDVPALYAIHRDAMFAYVNQTWGWDEVDQIQRFQKYASASPLQVIEVDGQPAGFVHIEYTLDAVDIVNIELSSKVQGRGLGSLLLNQLIADASERGVPVILQVLKVNSGARRLYERLGFKVISETDTHTQMRMEFNSQ